MRNVVLVLAGIVAVVLLGGAVLHVVGWLLGVLAWLAVGALVIGGGVWIARRVRGSDAPVVTGPDRRPLR